MSYRDRHNYWKTVRQSLSPLTRKPLSLVTNTGVQSVASSTPFTPSKSIAKPVTPMTYKAPMGSPAPCKIVKPFANYQLQRIS